MNEFDPKQIEVRHRRFSRVEVRMLREMGEHPHETFRAVRLARLRGVRFGPAYVALDRWCNEGLAERREDPDGRIVYMFTDRGRLVAAAAKDGHVSRKPGPVATMRWLQVALLSLAGLFLIDGWQGTGVTVVRVALALIAWFTVGKVGDGIGNWRREERWNETHR